MNGGVISIMVITVRKSKVFGFRVLADGSVEDFEAVVDKHYTDLVRATNSVRRLMHDQLITITSIEKMKPERYFIDDDVFYSHAEKC